MPLYNYQCQHCEGIFEALHSIDRRNDPQSCPYCQREIGSAPMITGSHTIVSKSAWLAQSKVELLTGTVDTSGPGVNPDARRTSVLHTCKGYNCSLCNG